jgi:prepilin-type N-terminal cleavage/methylation domain-containing protein|tara:strand:- start:189 stop:788 length:600 start_codon:yes stop_codon:yes gene_type:complete
MSLTLTLLQEEQKSKNLSDNGFSLLEVIVALAIMAMGFVTVSQLFSGSIRSIGLSEQYLKATTLAHSKLGELEINNYNSPEFKGTFISEKNYHWDLEISPYSSELNSTKNNIQLSEVILNVHWRDANQIRNIKLNTLKVNGSSHPGENSFLANAFQGRSLNFGTEEAEEASEDFQNISGRKTNLKNYISGASTSHLSGS